MTPSEHALSQRVLEFLIAQQDWFMLDIPTPSFKKPGIPAHTSAEIDDTALVPSSDEETSGGWKLVDRDSPKIPRLKITSGHSGMSNLGFLAEAKICDTFLIRYSWYLD
jgi:hypothetical protein